MTTEDVAHGCFVEAHFVAGLAPFVRQELEQLLGRRFVPIASTQPHVIRFKLIDNWTILNQIHTATAFYVGRHYPISRPKALLGHQHFQQLLQQLALVCGASRHWTFRSFRIEAAGADSSIFQRLREQIAQATALVDDLIDGELVIRIFPTHTKVPHWTVLCRLTPRPLSTRAWRVADLPGALNATVAAAMNRLSDPQPTDRYLNLMCGSGTLLIERLYLDRAVVAVGCDTSTTALAAAQQNVVAAGLTNQVMLLNEDATRLPFPTQSFDVLVADLPWGQLIGEHAINEMLYPQLMREAARVATDGARFIVITTEVRLFEKTLRDLAHLWHMRATIKLTFKNLHPRLYWLQRMATASDNWHDLPV